MAAATSLLATKLGIPSTRPTFIPRPRLHARLRQGLTRPLTLISAPAGYGKTSLLSDWHASAGHGFPLAWLSLDPGDNDPARFVHYLVAALQTLDVGWLAGPLDPLHGSQHLPLEPVLTELNNALGGVDRDFGLVLDDYHCITAPVLHDALAFLLDHRPAQMHLVIVTRADPPLPLARLRACDQLTEIRAEHLRFTSDETASFLRQMAGASLSAADVAALEARTEGWIAGLQLAALSLQDVADPAAFVAAFRGNERYIADYLVEEVLQRQPVEFQEFLLRTSVLDRLSGPLCNALTGRKDSQAVLSYLERANLFLVALDGRREWFRYHPLFADLLRQRLGEAAGPDEVRRLEQRAGQWFAEQGLLVEAVELALACGDFAAAADRIEQLGQQLLVGNEMMTLLRWCAALPDSVVGARPQLNLMVAWTALATGHPQQSEQFVQLIEQAAGITIEAFLAAGGVPPGVTDLQKSALVEAAVIRSRLALDRFDLERTFALARGVLPYLTVERDAQPCAFNLPSVLYGPELFCQGVAHKYQGNLAAAAELLATAADEAIRLRNPHMVAVSLGHLGEVQVLQGRLRQAGRTFQRSLHTAESYPPHSSAFFGMAMVGLGSLAFERNDLEAAANHLQSGLALGRLWRSWECLLPGYVCLARLHAARGEWDRAFAALDEVLQLTEHNSAIVSPMVEAWRALLALRRGDRASAADWAGRLDPEAPDELRLRWEQNALVLARFWLAEGKLAEALRLLDRLLAEADAGGRSGRVVEILVLQALGNRGQPGSSLRLLAKALALAEPEDYVRVFADEGPAMADLLRQAGSAGIVPGYAARLLPAIARGSDRVPAKLQPLAEPLSRRELEVLQLLATGQSNQAIAAGLVISVGTVKKHLSNIFDKLGVDDRLQCVVRARELGLLSSEQQAR